MILFAKLTWFNKWAIISSRSFRNNLQKIDKDIPFFCRKLAINGDQLLLFFGKSKFAHGGKSQEIIHGDVEKSGKSFQRVQIRLMLALLIIAYTRFAQANQVSQLLLGHMPGLAQFF